MLTALSASTGPIGAKAERLRRMSLHGYPIPRAFVMPWWDGAATDPLVRAEIAALLAGPLADLPLVVRSSASDEDRAIGNAPGVYLSYLGLRTVDDVLKAMICCGDSLRSPDAEAYRRLRGCDDPPGMSILVQQMIQCEASGVLYTRNPVSESGTMLVEATDGLGTDIVTGARSGRQFMLQRQMAWSRPERWSVTSDVELRDRLLSLGHLLEEEFEAPQDIEWGVQGGAMYVFQSRNASLSRVRLPLPTQRPRPLVANRVAVLSPGYGIGTIKNARIANALRVAQLDSLPTTAELEKLLDCSALLVKRGTACSHAAAVCREMGIPVLTASEPVETQAMLFVDAVSGSLVPLGILPPQERKRAIFASVRQLAARRVDHFRQEDKYETVIFDPVAQVRLRRWVDSTAPHTLRCVRQTIYPYDDAERSYCGISARIQVTDGISRIQFKRANLLPDRPFRFDEEVHVSALSVAEGDRFLRSLGYLPFDVQERDLETAVIDEVRLIFNRWPGAAQSYLSLEAGSVEAAMRLLASAHVAHEECAALDGKDLFDRLSLPLSGVRFS